ncbi:hypothetical protein SGA02_24330 [Staphylococcus gallinarum]|uniref:Uncharacterized protein n=1 Tax=Staphylococcus gallinarum TaxID=1293 RepID=A0ABQ0Y5D8_STAGA|nr:hypothetical protein SGA02_24330 [Staphylococcus gallinarum]
MKKILNFFKYYLIILVIFIGFELIFKAELNIIRILIIPLIFSFLITSFGTNRNK